LIPIQYPIKRLILVQCTKKPHISVRLCGLDGTATYLTMFKLNFTVFFYESHTTIGVQRKLRES
jgi:hypothetical protein